MMKVFKGGRMNEKKENNIQEDETLWINGDG